MLTAIRIKADSHRALKEIARITGRSIQEELDCAIEERRRRVYLEGLAEDYAKLRQNAKSSADLDRENAVWEATSSDGLEE